MNEDVKQEIKKLHKERAKAKKELHNLCKMLLHQATPERNLTPAQG